ncbi:aminotransferase class V-fold PLP-dependent enzyme [Isobaculum melis]|uniref:Aminotransferase class-V n=1 Tax=Isobaculum melis TaxID=142588 RepID=A0A1H9UAM4_9LACT|nr:aminotransferase class V-fold PLP-dependent enzyme [Isobaculum melis]SES06382.1 Aminotransferase class-V [Isobaculum melis]
METYPLTSLTIEEATQKQFALVDAITKEFKGSEILTRGDLGVVPGLNQPKTTHQVEKVLANFFDAEAAMLVRGAGTMAIRLAMHAVLKAGDTLLVHDAPVYPTTQTSIEMMNLKVIKADFNDLEAVKAVAAASDIQGALVQFTRQKPDDSYDIGEVIAAIQAVLPDCPIITDDNYAVLKVPQIGSELGATMACFSTFKLLGPEGVGCIIGSKVAIAKLRKENYSGGLQVQGFEAIAVLQGLIYAPVALAISAQVSGKVCTRLNNGEIPGVKKAFIANAQSKVLLIELEEANANEVLIEAEKLGAAPNPIGAESKYEFVPMFYRLSGTFRAANPKASESMIRVNPMRSGEETVLRILKEAILKAAK